MVHDQAGNRVVDAVGVVLVDVFSLGEFGDLLPVGDLERAVGGTVVSQRREWGVGSGEWGVCWVVRGMGRGTFQSLRGSLCRFETGSQFPNEVLAALGVVSLSRQTVQPGFQCLILQARSRAAGRNCAAMAAQRPGVAWCQVVCECSLYSDSGADNGRY